jgi:hypothetical protein
LAPRLIKVEKAAFSMLSPGLLSLRVAKLHKTDCGR